MEHVHCLSVSKRSLNKERGYLPSKANKFHIFQENVFGFFFPEIAKNFQGDAQYILHQYLFYEVI